MFSFLGVPSGDGKGQEVRMTDASKATVIGTHLDFVLVTVDLNSNRRNNRTLWSQPAGAFRTPYASPASCLS